MPRSSKLEDQGYLYKHVLEGGAVVADVREGNIIMTPYLEKHGIHIWLVTSGLKKKDTRISIFDGKGKNDAVYAVRLFYHLAFPGTYEFYDQKGRGSSIQVTGVQLSEPRVKKSLPVTVERYYKEHIDQGVSPDVAWALSWSRYCKYSYPDSTHCKRKPSAYFVNK